MTSFVTKDSGAREVYGSGFQRDIQEGKSRPDLISPFFTERLGYLLARGARKYSEWNWAKGQPFSRAIASLERHLMQYKMGLRDEDHLAAVAFGVMCLVHYEEMIDKKILPPVLNDLPKFDQRLAAGIELTPASEVVMVPDFPSEVADETIEGLQGIDSYLADTAEMPVVRMCPDRSDAIAKTAKNTRFHDDSETVVVEPNVQVCPDSTNVFFTDEEMVAKLRNAVSPLRDQTRGAIRIQIENDIRKKRAAEVGDRMEQVLKGLGGISHERPE